MMLFDQHVDRCPEPGPDKGGGRGHCFDVGKVLLTGVDSGVHGGRVHPKRSGHGVGNGECIGDTVDYIRVTYGLGVVGVITDDCQVGGGRNFCHNELNGGLDISKDEDSGSESDARVVMRGGKDGGGLWTVGFDRRVDHGGKDGEGRMVDAGDVVSAVCDNAKHTTCPKKTLAMNVEGEGINSHDSISGLGNRHTQDFSFDFHYPFTCSGIVAGSRGIGGTSLHHDGAGNDIDISITEYSKSHSEHSMGHKDNAKLLLIACVRRENVNASLDCGVLTSAREGTDGNEGNVDIDGGYDHGGMFPSYEANEKIHDHDALGLVAAERKVRKGMNNCRDGVGRGFDIGNISGLVKCVQAVGSNVNFGSGEKVNLFDRFSKRKSMDQERNDSITGQCMRGGIDSWGNRLKLHGQRRVGSHEIQHSPRCKSTHHKRVFERVASLVASALLIIGNFACVSGETIYVRNVQADVDGELVGFNTYGDPDKHRFNGNTMHVSNIVWIFLFLVFSL